MLFSALFRRRPMPVMPMPLEDGALYLEDGALILVDATAEKAFAYNYRRGWRPYTLTKPTSEMIPLSDN